MAGPNVGDFASPKIVAAAAAATFATFVAGTMTVKSGALVRGMVTFCAIWGAVGLAVKYAG